MTIELLDTPPATATDDRLVALDMQRQVAHWLAAAATFTDAEQFASEPAWRAVENHVGRPLRKQLGQTVVRLVEQGRATAEAVRRAQSDATGLSRATDAVQAFRRAYAQVETTLEFFGNAVNSRTSATLRNTLQNLDRLASASIAPVLLAAGKPVPPVLCYVDQGMGASILRAGVRLWDPGTVNPVAAIKIVRHNLYRPTSLFHETGHQIAHLTGWTPSVAAALGRALSDDPKLGRMWSPWASEIAADVFAFVHTGYASVSALYDVVGDRRSILRWPLGDPHPIGWLRTLLGCALSRHAFGAGPWDQLRTAVIIAHPPSLAGPTLAELLHRSDRTMDRIADACLTAPVPALGNRPMSSVHDPSRVSPRALATLERTGGDSLWTSPHWRSAEGIRLIALAGLREAEHPERAGEWINRARTWLSQPPVAA